MESFPQIGGSDADENLRWEIPVAENMTSWNKSGEEPALQIEFSKPGYSAVTCLIFLCGGWFRFYYSDYSNDTVVQALFPIVNLTEEGPGDGDGGDGLLGGAVLAAGLGALAMAAIASSRREE